MGGFNDFTSWINNQAPLFTLGILGFANHVWGDSLFSCPCKSVWRHCVYTMSHALSPAFLVFVFDTHLKAARANRHINQSLQCCLIFRRPVILAVAWLVYSITEPRFAECLTQYDNCTSKAEEDKGDLLTAIAIFILIGSIVAFFVCFYWTMHRRRTFLSNRPQQEGNHNITPGNVPANGASPSTSGGTITPGNVPANGASPSTSGGTGPSNEEEMLKTHLKGLSPKIISVLLNEDLLNLNLLAKLDSEDLKHLKHKLTIGQMKLLKETLKKITPVTGSPTGGDQPAPREAITPVTGSPTGGDPSTTSETLDEHQTQQQGVGENGLELSTFVNNLPQTSTEGAEDNHGFEQEKESLLKQKENGERNQLYTMTVPSSCSALPYLPQPSKYRYLRKQILYSCQLGEL